MFEAWEGWADKTPEAREMVDSHYEFMELFGLRDAGADGGAEQEQQQQ